MELHFNDTVKSGSGNTMMGPLTKWIIIPFGCHIFFYPFRPKPDKGIK